MELLYTLLLLAVAFRVTTASDTTTEADSVPSLEPQAAKEAMLMKQKIASLEKKIQDYDDDRNQWTKYAQVITETQSRVAELEKEKDFLRHSLQEVRKTLYIQGANIQLNTQDLQEVKHDLQVNIETLQAQDERLNTDLQNLQYSTNTSIKELLINDRDINNSVDELQDIIYSVKNEMRQLDYEKRELNESIFDIQNRLDKIDSVEGYNNSVVGLNDTIFLDIVPKLISSIKDLKINDKKLSNNIRGIENTLRDINSNINYRNNNLTNITHRGNEASVTERRYIGKEGHHQIRDVQNKLEVFNTTVKLLTTGLQATNQNIRNIQEKDMLVNLSIKNLQTSYWFTNSNMRDLHNGLQTVKTNLNALKGSVQISNTDIEHLKDVTQSTKLDIHGLHNTTQQIQTDMRSAIHNVEGTKDTLLTMNDTMTNTIDSFLNRITQFELNFKNYEEDIDIITNVMNKLNKNFNQQHKDIKDNFTTSMLILGNNLENLTTLVNTLQSECTQKYTEVKDNFTSSMSVVSNNLQNITTFMNELQTIMIQDIEIKENISGSYSWLAGYVDRNIDTLRTDVSTLQQKHNFTMVTFSGELSSSKTISNIPMKFSNIEVSTGGGYNSTDGKFYPPYRGWYLFDVTVRAHDKTGSYAYLVKNNNDTISINSGYTPSNSYPSSSRSVALYLEQSDRVWVRGSSSFYYSSRTSLSITLLRV